LHHLALQKEVLTSLASPMAGRLTSGASVGGQFFKYDSEEIDLRLTAKGLTEDDLRELGEGLRAGRFHRLKRLNLVGVGILSLIIFLKMICAHQGGNGITDKGALVLAEALQVNCGLQWLDLVSDTSWSPNNLCCFNCNTR